MHRIHGHCQTSGQEGKYWLERCQKGSNFNCNLKMRLDKHKRFLGGILKRGWSSFSYFSALKNVGEDIFSLWQCPAFVWCDEKNWKSLKTPNRGSIININGPFHAIVNPFLGLEYNREESSPVFALLFGVTWLTCEKLDHLGWKLAQKWAHDALTMSCDFLLPNGQFSFLPFFALFKGDFCAGE